MMDHRSSCRKANEFGIATISLGNPEMHSMEVKLKAASDAGFKQIDLFDGCWAEYLRANGQDPATLWEATDENLRIAKQLGDLVKNLGMQIYCTQPLRNIEGHKDPATRKKAFELVAKRFPFMRAFDTDLMFMCASVDTDPSTTMDYKVVAKDLADIGRMAEDFSKRDGGRMIRVAYEGLSWARRHTWASTWEVVRAANRHNVGLILDSFNILGVEYADPYNAEGHGRIYSTEQESLDLLRMSLASLVATIPGDRIFFVQLADAELMDPTTFHRPSDPEVFDLLPWSRQHRLYPLERDRGAYMPIDLVTSAILATGYAGPISLEVFAASLNKPDSSVPVTHAQRGIDSLKKLSTVSCSVEKFWGEPVATTTAHQIWKKNETFLSS